MATTLFRLSGLVLVLSWPFQMALAQPAPIERREIGNQILENVVDPSEAEATLFQRYQNARSAAFQDFLPDGGILIATRFAQTAQLHRVAMAGGARQQVTYFNEPVSFARAIPGTNLTLMSKDKGGDEWFQLHVTDFKGKSWVLTEPGTRNTGAVIARDGRQVLWSVSRKGSADTEIMTADPSRPDSRTLVLKAEGAMFALDIAPDGKTALLGRAISIGEAKRYVLDLATSTLRELNPSPNRIAYEGGTFTPDGKGILWITNQGADTRRLVRFDLASGAIFDIAAPKGFDVEDFDLADNGALAYGVNEDGYSRLYLGTLGKKTFVRPKGLPDGVIGGLRFSKDGTKLGVSVNAPIAPTDSYVIATDTATATRWTSSEIGEIDPQSLVAPSLIRYPSFDRRMIPAFVYKPKNVVGKLPVILDIHGGPEGQSRPTFSTATQARLAFLGAAVIYPNVRGSSGYGQTYLDLDNGAKREDSVKDIGALLDWIATQSDLDPNRVIVYGGSYGGYMVLACMTHYSDRLLGGINLFGISNFLSFLDNTEAYRRDLRRVEYGDERDPAMRTVFEKISPINNIDKITKPMMVMQGWNDPRVPKSESDQIVNGLRTRSIPVSYVQFKDEGHGFRKKVNADRQRDAEMMFMKDLLAK